MGANGWVTIVGGAVLALGQYFGGLEGALWGQVGGILIPIGTLIAIIGSRRALGKLISK